MKRNSNKFKALACTIAGCVVLSGAVFANIDNASGYSGYKNAVKNLIKLQNYTAEFKVTGYLDDIEISSVDVEYKFEGNGVGSSKETSRSADNNSSYKNGLSDIEKRNNETYQDGGVRVNSYNFRYINGEEAGNIYINIDEEDENDQKTYNPLLGANVDEQLLDKIVSFTEVAADGFIGDIKNNFVYLGEENNEKHYNVTLSKEQMPNIITSGLSLVCGIAQQEHSDYINGESAAESELSYDSVSDVMDMILLNEKEPFIKSASCDFKIDSNGNLVNNVLSGNIIGYTNDGAEHSFGLRIEISLKDIGTTVADRYDIYSLAGDIEMLDGSIKNFEELVNSCRSITIVDGKKDIYVNNDFDYDSNSNKTNHIYILNGKEINNQEYNNFKKTETELLEDEADSEEEGLTVNYDSEKTAASVGVIGGEDGPTEIVITNKENSESEANNNNSGENAAEESETNDSDTEENAAAESESNGGATEQNADAADAE